ncbi:unnamed protein product, partial [Brenthis ino]
MRCELPMLTRCCFCFPLRLGLLVWAYIKMISCTILLSLLLHAMIVECVAPFCHIRMTFLFTFQIPVLTMLFTDIIFHIIFIISAHKKEHRIMRVFYRYSIFSFTIYILLFISSVTHIALNSSYFMHAFLLGLFHLAVLMFIIVIQIYVLILVRSEIVKLKRNTKFEFVNHAAEADQPSAKVEYVDVEDLHY